MREKKIKQPRHGLKIEKNLRVVKTAGFRAEKRRDKSVNRRAGLHDKIKNLRGERRVYKCKPLGIVHVRRIKQTVATFSAGLVAVAAYFGMGFLFKPDFIYVEELGNSTVCAAKSSAEPAGLKSAAGNEYYMPEDGSLPTDHTLIENVAYMNYVLKNQPSWSSYMESTVKTVMEQKVYTHKKMYDGKLISADMPQGASNIARQFCVTDTDVSWREKSKNYIYDSMDNIDWPSDKPTGLTVADFRIYRGLPANEFSVYILNELTVKNFEDKTVEEKGVDENGKRLYTMKLDLRVHQSGLDSAVHYYKQQMYVTGGLYAWPTFDFTTVEYTFTEDWVIKEFTINDGYSAKMGTVSAPCTSSSTTVFDYSEEKAENTYYPDYFNQSYVKWDPTSSGNEITAASCLASAFGDVLTQGATLKLELKVDEKPVNGAVYLGMAGGNFNDLRVALDGAGVGGIKLYMLDENGVKTLYIAIGANKYKICFDAFTSAGGGEVSALAEDAGLTDGTAESGSGGIAFDANALLEQLFSGKFELGKNGKTATLESEIEIFGLKAPVKFSFNIKKGVASLNEVTADLKLGKNDVAARMTFGTEEDIPANLTAAEKAAYADLSDGITLGVNLGLGGVRLDGTAYIGFADGGFGEVRAKLGGVNVCYAAADNTLYISHGNNVKYKLNLSDVALSGGAGFDLGAAFGGLDLNSVITDAISNFYMGGGIISTGMKVDLQQQLQQILNLAVAVDFNNGIAVDLNSEIFGKPLKLNVSLASDSVPQITDKSQYVDILNGGISADVELTVDGIKFGGVLYLELKDGNINAVRVSLKNSAVKVYYEKEINGENKDDVLYIDLGASKIKLPLSSLTTNAGGFDIGSLFKDIKLDEIIAQVLNNLGGGENKITSQLSLTVNGEVIPVSFGVDLGEKLSVNAGTTLFGKNITANISLSNGKVPQITDKSQYVDVVNDGFALSGNILINVNGKSAVLAVNSLALKLNGGFEFELDARIIAGGKYFDLYASYIGNTVTLVYGSDEGTEGDRGNYVGVRVNTADDLELLKNALTDAYNRLCIVLETVAPSSTDALTKENLEKLIGNIGAGSSSADMLAELFKILGIELGEGEEASVEAILTRLGIPVCEDGKIDIKGLLKAIEIKPIGGGFALNLGKNISVSLSLGESAVNGGVSVVIGNASATVAITEFKLGAFAPECPVSESGLMSAEDLADALDYIVAAFELVAETEFTVDADIVISENGAEKLGVGVTVEYSQGENGFPVHIDTGKVNEKTGLREGVNFRVDSSVYLHLNLEISDKKADKNNLYIDAYVLDATPEKSGYVTGGNYVTDGELDIYLSVSNGGGNPLAVYLPMKDLLTIAAMGGAMLNVADIKIDGEYAADINKAIQQIAVILDELLIENYLGGLSSQFQSLGDSMIEQILRGQKVEASNLSELLNLLLNSVFGGKTSAASYSLSADGETAESVPVTPVVPQYTCGNYVKRVSFDRNGTERALSVVLNSSAIYGGGFEDISFNISKYYFTYGVMPVDDEEAAEEGVGQTVVKSYITGLSLNNVYYGENYANKLDLSASVKYEVAKPETLANYRNFSDISSLVAAFVNSATHEVPDETAETENNGSGEGENEVITATDIAKKYALNSNYYIDGNIKIEVSGLSWLGLNANVSINNFYVTINEDNTVEFNLSIYHDSFVGVITEKATVDMTIKDDLIIMRKTADGGKTYVTRVMTLKDFFGDIINQIQFIFAFSDTIMNAMTGGSGGGSAAVKDFGDYLDNYLANYGYSESNGTSVWSIDISKKAINSLAGMEVFSQDIAVKLNAVKQSGTQYKLTSLNIGSKLFGLLNFTANLNYRNPQNIWEGGNDLSGNAVKLDCKAQYGVDGRSWTTILGGTKFEDVSNTVNWSKLCRDTSGKNYIEYNGSNLKCGTLKFEYAADISNTEFEEFGERQVVLYGKSVYTVLDRPDISEVMPAVPNGDDRLVGSWDYSYVSTEETDENGAVIAMRAKYGAVTVSIISSQLVEGGINGFTEYYTDEDLGYVYYKTFRYNDTEEVKLNAQNNLNTYIFKGYYDYYTGEAVESFVADRAVTLYAHWEGKKINVTYSGDVAFGGSEVDGNGIYSLSGSLQYGVNDSLRTPVTEAENISFMGWFAEDGESYVYIADADALKNYLAAAEIAGDSVGITLWAVWTDNLSVSITEAKKSWGTWTVRGNYSGGGFAGEVSGKIAAKAITRKAEVRYELANAEGVQQDVLNNKAWYDLGESYSFGKSSMTTLNSSSYGGARVKVTFTFNAVGGQQSISCEAAAYKSK